MPMLHYAPNAKRPKPDIRTASMTFIFRFWTELDGKRVKISTPARTEQEARQNLNCDLLFCARIRQEV